MNAPPRYSIGLILCFLLALSSTAVASDQLFLLRNISLIKPQADDLTKGTETAYYKPIFGEGDKQGKLLNGVVRFGELTVYKNGASAVVSYPDEEQIYYVTSGEGTLIYDDQEVAIKANDFMYLPVGVKRGVKNANEDPIQILVMGYSIPEDVEVEPTQELQLASADEVKLLVLGSHGPTTKYKLLMGTTESARDRLAAAYQMVSLFIMDFSPGGTNKPHRHPTQEEMYYVLKGHGYMVAGLDRWGNVQRHPCQAGDAFYFAAGTEVGFYSTGREGEEHALILAVRSDDPTLTKK